MSWLSKLNPLNWIKDLLVSDYVGGLLRHALTALGVVLVRSGLATQPVADNAVQALMALLLSPEFVGGIIAFVTGWGSSVANKNSD